MVEALVAVTATANAPFAIQPITVDDLRSAEMIDRGSSIRGVLTF